MAAAISAGSVGVLPPFFLPSFPPASAPGGGAPARAVARWAARCPGAGWRDRPPPQERERPERRCGRTPGAGRVERGAGVSVIGVCSYLGRWRRSGPSRREAERPRLGLPPCQAQADGQRQGGGRW